AEELPGLMTGPFFTTAGIVVAALYWLEAGVSAVLGNRCTPGLGSVEPLPDERLPSLSIIATAKDEAEGVEQAARSLLAQDYPHVRTIIADDRSTDATGRILDRLAAEEPRLHVLHVGSLPEGWIGTRIAGREAMPRFATSCWTISLWARC